MPGHEGDMERTHQAQMSSEEKSQTRGQGLLHTHPMWETCTGPATVLPRATFTSLHHFLSIPTHSPGGFAQPTVLPSLHLSPISPGPRSTCESGGGTGNGHRPA